MNKVYKVKKNKFGQSVVTSELAKNNSVSTIVKASMLSAAIMSTLGGYAQSITLDDPIESATVMTGVGQGNSAAAVTVDVGYGSEIKGDYILNNLIRFNSNQTAYGFMLNLPTGQRGESNIGLTENAIIDVTSTGSASGVFFRGAANTSYDVNVSVKASQINVTGGSLVTGINIMPGTASATYSVDVDNRQLDMVVTRTGENALNGDSVVGILLNNVGNLTSTFKTHIKNINNLIVTNQIGSTTTGGAVGIRGFAGNNTARVDIDIDIDNANLISVKQADASTAYATGIIARTIDGGGEYQH